MSNASITVQFSPQELEALAVEAIATNDWDAFYQHLIEFQSQHDLHGVTGIAIGEGENE